MRRTLLVLAAVGLLVACGSDEPAETTAAEPDSTTAETTAETMADTTTTEAMAETTMAAEESDTATITMSGRAFSGAQTVQIGQTIELVNSDGEPHTWTADSGPFDVSIPAGETATYSFDEAGEFTYFCKLHPSMSGTIRVEG